MKLVNLRMQGYQRTGAATLRYARGDSIAVQEVVKISSRHDPPPDDLVQTQGMFSTEGQLPPVHPSVRLVAGLFNDSLPVLLAKQDAASPTGRLPDLTYLHVDCDLYAGAHCSSAKREDGRTVCKLLALLTAADQILQATTRSCLSFRELKPQEYCSVRRSE